MHEPISKAVSSASPRVFSRPAILKSGQGPGDEVDPNRFILILVPIALFASLSRQGLGMRIEGLWRHRISES